MFVPISLSLFITKDMLTIYLFYFDLLTTLKNLRNLRNLRNLNTKHANIKFTNEKEINGSLPFLVVLISQNIKCFTTTVYHKPTFSRVYSNFNSFVADESKHRLTFPLLFRTFSIVSDFSKFHEVVNWLKYVLKKNSFLTTLADKHNIIQDTVPKKELFIVLCYLGLSSFCLITRLQKQSIATFHFIKLKLFLNHQHD